MSSPISYDLQGQGGGQVLTSGGVFTANIRWIQCLTDCVFSDFTAPNLVDGNNIASVTIPAGVGIGGNITEVGLTSGLAIAYFA